MSDRTYIAIDLKSFYASVECVERGLDPLNTHLVVADVSRTQKTICLAVSPALKAYGIPGRARLFEVEQRVQELNTCRRIHAPHQTFCGCSHQESALSASPALALSYIAAPPRMALYLAYSTRIYQIYLNYIAPEDIHVYSIDEVFIDVTPYLSTYQQTARELAQCILLDILRTTGITATAGIGTNLYLCKVAMDIVAKHAAPDHTGVRIAQLNEMTYRRLLWSHRPITDFWRVGAGYAKKLEQYGLSTMGDIARCSIGKPYERQNAALLYRLFGVNAELLIDHAWGWEPCTITDIKKYRPAAKSIGAGQVLPHPYSFDKARLVCQEMADQLSLDLTSHHLTTGQLVLTVGYDRTGLLPQAGCPAYHGPTTVDAYGRTIPKHAHGTAHLLPFTDSSQKIRQRTLQLFDRLVNPRLPVRRITLTACRICDADAVQTAAPCEQLSLFTDPAQQAAQTAARQRERQQQQAILHIKRKYGKNALIRGMSLLEDATAISRNLQIGGHKA